MNETRQPEPHHRTALLAEDDELIRDIVTQYLERLGYHVLEAKNGRVAVDIIERMETGKIDLIVTDLLMPKAGGEAVIAAAQQKEACARFLVMSGFSNEMAASRSDLSSVSSYIAKPFTFGAFQEKVGELSQAKS